jgi:Predicted metal-dependent phosphoesterases (PHP family)
MILIDLHTHSTCSDGTLKPEALVRAAKARKVSVLSLTDHDTTEGVPEFLAACRHTGVRGLSGIELSADAPYTLHILGYNIAPGNGPLEKRLEILREHRKDRNVAICQRLRELGLDVALEEVEEEAKGDVIARPHIARVLIRKGYVQDMGWSFSKLSCRWSRRLYSEDQAFIGGMHRADSPERRSSRAGPPRPNGAGRARPEESPWRAERNGALGTRVPVQPPSIRRDLPVPQASKCHRALHHGGN